MRIDGRLAIEEEFDVGEGEGSQHNWHTYHFRLDPGKHVLTAGSRLGRARLEKDFDLPAKRWAGINFWAPSETDTRYFSFEIREEASAFE
ncbi:MAG: hypothetical protein ACYS0K_04560 [Planctomycetota bacterium]